MVLPDAIDFEDADNEVGVFEPEFDPDDNDDAYDAWADSRTEDYFDILKERQVLYKKLLLCTYNGNHNDERDELEKKLVYNLTRSRDNWIDMNSIHNEEW